MADEDPFAGFSLAVLQDKIWDRVEMHHRSLSRLGCFPRSSPKENKAPGVVINFITVITEACLPLGNGKNPPV